MYLLIEESRLPDGRHYEKMPDGRCIVSGSEARMMGTLEGVTIVPTTTALLELIAAQEESADTVQQEESAGVQQEPGNDTEEEE